MEDKKFEEHITKSVKLLKDFMKYLINSKSQNSQQIIDNFMDKNTANSLLSERDILSQMKTELEDLKTNPGKNEVERTTQSVDLVEKMQNEYKKEFDEVKGNKHYKQLSKKDQEKLDYIGGLIDKLETNKNMLKNKLAELKTEKSKESLAKLTKDMKEKGKVQDKVISKEKVVKKETPAL